MKIQGAKKVHYDSGPNMIPLVDVVMVILIFLMLAGSFGGLEHYLVSNAAFQAKGTVHTPPPPNFIAPVNIAVNVDLDKDSIAEAAGLQGDDASKALRYKATMGGKVYSSYDSLRAQMGELAANPLYKDKENVQVVISPGARVLHRHLVDVYQAAVDAGFQKIAFAAAH